MEMSADYTDYADFVRRPKTSRENKISFPVITVFFTPAYDAVSNRNLRNLCNLRILNSILAIYGS
jgi:hypothetical protein